MTRLIVHMIMFDRSCFLTKRFIYPAFLIFGTPDFIYIIKSLRTGHQVIDLSTRGAGTSWYLPPDSCWELAEDGKMHLDVKRACDQVGLGRTARCPHQSVRSCWLCRGLNLEVKTFIELAEGLTIGVILINYFPICFIILNIFNWSFVCGPALSQEVAIDAIPIHFQACCSKECHETASPTINSKAGHNKTSTEWKCGFSPCLNMSNFGQPCGWVLSV